MNTPRVLIVDDNAMNIELASYVLTADAMITESALGAQQARERIQTFRPDLILMDIQMPGMNGLELTQLLKSEASTRHIVIIAHTAYAMKGDEAKMRAAGCDGYVSKPIDVTTLAAQIRAFLEPR